MIIKNKHLNKNIDLHHLLDTYHVTVSLDDIMKKYNHHSRYYHNFNHVVQLLEQIKVDDDRLIMAIVFHDIAFGGKIEQHELKSAQFFNDHCRAEDDFKSCVEKLILSTEYIKQEWNALEQEIIRVDRNILYKTDINSLLTWEVSIFKEFQHLSVDEYKAGRTSFLAFAYKETGNKTLLELRDIVAEKVYKVGFYPGSFNPFHIGHYNILEKAEKSFDKVVIGVGVNYEKKDLKRVDIPDIISNREIRSYSGLITTEIKKLSEVCEVFVVRGLRNAYDLQHEESLRNVIKDFLPQQEFVYYFCDKKYEHISSTVIRDIKSRGGDDDISMIDRYTFE